MLFFILDLVGQFIESGGGGGSLANQFIVIQKSMFPKIPHRLRHLLQVVRYTKEAAMAKLFTSEHANKTATKALQIFGGYGYTKD